ncbi:MAG: ABC transporter permease, partial [Actinobacteria bacterium]|nr:ABC transporter permease [Actinomycetota bacterium]
DLLKSPQAQDLITKLGGVAGLRDAFLAVELGFAGVFAAVFGVQATMRLRSEESALRAEPVLASPVGRTVWAWSHLTIALAGAAALLLVVGFSAGLASAVQLGDSSQFGRVVLAALVQIPAVWVVVGIVVAAFGLVPRFVVLGWFALVAFMLLGEFGPLFELSQAVMDISPFTHVPRLPGGDLAVAPLLWLTAVAAGLIAIGLVGFRRRDVG